LVEREEREDETKNSRRKNVLAPAQTKIFIKTNKQKMAPTNLSERLKAFADRFAALGRPAQGPGGGYTGLSDGGAGGLGAPLVGGGGGGSTGVGGEGRYYHQQQQAPSRYNPPQTTTTSQQYQQPHYGSVDAAGVGDAGAGAAVNLPTQVSD